MLAESMHGRRVSRIRVHTTPWAERHAGYPICGEMYRVRTGPPDKIGIDRREKPFRRGRRRAQCGRYLVAVVEGIGHRPSLEAKL